MGPTIMFVTPFRMRYFSLLLSISSWFPLFLAYLHSLLNFDLRFTLSFSSLSTNGAALIVCHFLPGLLSLVFFMVWFTATFNFSMQFLKPCLLPILAFIFSTHFVILTGFLLIHVILFLGFFLLPL